MSIEGKALFLYLPMTGPINVSVLSPLLEPTDFAGTMRGILVEVVNLDVTNPVTVFVTSIPGGSNPDVAKQAKFTVAAGQSGSYELEPDILRQTFEVTAETASPSFPTVQVQLQISVYVVQKHRWF